MRLAKFIAAAGVASRRKAEELISGGRIEVNGVPVFKQGFKINPGDKVEYQGRILTAEQNVYLLLNKPPGYICSVKDNHDRPTVMELVKDVGPRVYPVGRLDLDTEGLLLLTNDGIFSNLMTHPSHLITKKYEALVEGRVAAPSIKQLERGVDLEDGLTAPARVRVLKRNKDSTLLELEIHEGRKRQVKRMCLTIGHRVIDLKRTGFSFLNLNGVPAGRYRTLSTAEVERLIKTARNLGH